MTNENTCDAVNAYFIDNYLPEYSKCAFWPFCFYTEWLSALDYAKKWLGQYSYVICEDWQGEPLDYNGCGDMIEIRFNDGIEL